MFSSENNSYPLYYQSPSFANTISESNNILFQHHHLQHGKTNNYIMPPTYPQISENPMFKYSSQPLINQEHTINYPLNFINHMSSTRKTSGKKDRHTKIRTAQGVRDRRVRLSMSIAREFFNLQDMLGYDKASKTLGWLLAKSKAAIDELASNSKNNNIVAPLEGINNGEDDDEEDNDNCEEANNDEKKRDLSENKLISKKRKKRESNRLNKVEVSDKEAKRREKARERARERTRNKKILDDQKLLKSLDHQLHQRVQQDLMVCNSSSAATPNNNNVSPSYGCFGKGVSVGESVVIKGNKPRLGSSFNYNYDMISSKDDQETCNHYNDYIINKSSSESCNYGGIMQSPGLFPALNIINLSTEIHINGRPWDTFNNQILH